MGIKNEIRTGFAHGFALVTQTEPSAPWAVLVTVTNAAVPIGGDRNGKAVLGFLILFYVKETNRLSVLSLHTCSTTAAVWLLNHFSIGSKKINHSRSIYYLRTGKDYPRGDFYLKSGFTGSHHDLIACWGWAFRNTVV